MEKFLTKHPKVQKFLAFLLIIAIFIPTLFVSTPPKKTEAWGILNFSIAEFGVGVKNLAGQAFKQVAMGIARKMLNAMTARTVAWINSGFHGNPFYLTNTDAFVKDIVKFEVRNIVDTYAYNKTKFPFGKDFAINTIELYQRQLETNTQYTLSKAIQDPVYLEHYRDDFDVGGWDGFFLNTQYPQNNYIGFKALATEEIARKVDGTATTAANKVKDTLEKSQGFLAPKTCESNKAYNNGKNEFLQPGWTQSKEYQDINKKFDCGTDIPGVENTCKTQWTKELEAAKVAWETKNTCPGGLTTTTPGTVIANQILTATSSKFRQSELGQAVGNSLSAVFDALVSKLVDKSIGLLGMGKTVTPESSTATDFDYKGGIQPAAPPQDAQICLDMQTASGGDPATGSSGTSSTSTGCATLPGGSTEGGINPLDFFNFPGSGSTNGTGGSSNTGGNTKCINAEGVPAYDPYVSAVSTAEGVAYPNGLPSGTTGATAQAAVCGAYAGPGTCKAGAQEDEVIITGLSVPGAEKYVTLSIDFLTGGYPYASTALYSRGVAACEAGVQ